MFSNKCCEINLFVSIKKIFKCSFLRRSLWRAPECTNNKNCSKSQFHKCFLTLIGDLTSGKPDTYNLLNSKMQDQWPAGRESTCSGHSPTMSLANRIEGVISKHPYPPNVSRSCQNNCKLMLMLALVSKRI